MRGVVAAMAMEEPWSFTVDTNKRSQSKRVRFNLLALDHGEYYFQASADRKLRLILFE